MPMKRFRMTPMELKLKRERLMVAFRAGKSSIEDLGLPYFLANSSALGALRDGQFQPFEDDVVVGIFAWDLAALQRACPEPTAARRDGRLIATFKRFGFEPVSEVMDGGKPQGGKQPMAESACPRCYIAEGWSQEMAFPILYKFTHKESLVKFDILVFREQFGQLWDFADGGAETSCGWRFAPFAPQPMEFEKMMTFTMPAAALQEHYGQDWHVPRAYSYIENLSRCVNRCQVLRVLPWDASMRPLQLPSALSWEEFRVELRQYRIKYAKAMAEFDHEVPAKPLDLHKIESKPVVLFQASGLCKSDGNARLEKGNVSGALDKYEEGLYIMDKCREVLVTWRLIFRQIHQEKAENDRKNRGLKYTDLVEPDMPREFRTDEAEEHAVRLALLLNAARAALELERWEAAAAHAGLALDLDAKCLKALYRRGLARLRSGREELAKTDFWAMVRFSDFESKEALAQLMKLMPKEEMQHQMKKVKASLERERKLGTMVTEMDTDDRVGIQEERYQRYLGDCAQRKADGQREVSFDDWARQYEWRYDADERAKARASWPECFSNRGVAPLPVEHWEVDYLTHKEIHKIMYHRQSAAMAAKRRERDGGGLEEEEDTAAPQEGFQCKLEVDAEDEQLLREAVVKKGYTYWW